MHGHIAANYLEHHDLEPPFMSLVVSGGHTNIVNVPDYNKCEKTVGASKAKKSNCIYKKLISKTTSSRFTTPLLCRVFSHLSCDPKDRRSSRMLQHQ
jgi:hypothetical protein